MRVDGWPHLRGCSDIPHVLQVSIGDFVRLGYKGHLAGQLELVHAVMDDGSLGASLDYWIAGCPKGALEAGRNPATPPSPGISRRRRALNRGSDSWDPW